MPTVSIPTDTAIKTYVAAELSNYYTIPQIDASQLAQDNNTSTIDARVVVLENANTTIDTRVTILEASQTTQDADILQLQTDVSSLLGSSSSGGTYVPPTTPSVT